MTGTIQNPAGGTPLDHLIAVVDAFDSADQVVATVTSGVDASMLLSGDTTRFVVAIPRADSVARYRVRFRLRDGSAIPHRDERAKEGIMTMTTRSRRGTHWRGGGVDHRRTGDGRLAAGRAG